MVTNYPQVFAAAQARGHVGFSGGVRLVLRRMGQAFCGLRGHDRVRHYERNRVALECASCGQVSPGWTVGGSGPVMRYAGDPLRHRLRQGQREA